MSVEQADVVTTASQNFTVFEWTKVREKAALEVAHDLHPDEAIAKQAKVSRRQLATWKQHPSFQVRVNEHRTLWAEQLKALGLADRQNRIAAKNDRWQRLHQVIAERAVHPTYADAPGGKTGLLVHQVKQIGAGRDVQIIDEFAVDTGLLKEMRDLEKEAAQELGQWVPEKSGPDVLVLVQAVYRSSNESGMPVEEILSQLAPELQARIRPALQIEAPK